jgi:hypothetical protein
MNINSSQSKFKSMSNVDQNSEFKGTPGPWKFTDKPLSEDLKDRTEILLTQILNDDARPTFK